MATKLTTGTRNAKCDAFADQLDGSAGSLRLYKGTVPTSADDAEVGADLIATITLPAPAFGAAASGQVDKTGTWQTTNAQPGGAVTTYYRLVTNGGTCIAQGECADDGSVELDLSSTNIVAGGTITITAFSHLQPAT